MKKKLVIISVMVLFIGIVLGFEVKFSKDAEKEESNLSINFSRKEKRNYYVSNVPMINQEYAIYYNNKENIVKERISNDYIGTEKEIVINDVNEVSIESDNEDSEENNSMNEEDENNNGDTIREDIKDMVEIMVDTDDSIENNDQKEIDESKVDNNVKDNVISETPKLKNGFYIENQNKYFYEDDVKVVGLKNIDGVDNYFSPSGKHLGTNNIKVIDVSYYQKDVDWDLFARDSDCYGVILRLGYYQTLDKKFERNISELKRLNIPYGIYLFSYASTLSGAKKEADFTNKMISKYDINPTLGIYYDIESWSTKTSNSNSITKSMYDKIVQHYINSVSYYTNYKYKVKVYSGRWYAMNRLGNVSKKYVDWVAEYNKTCKYDDIYFMWQYTSKGNVPGINGNVDISYIL